MEVTIYSLFFLLVLLAYYLHHREPDPMPTINHILNGLMLGFLLIVLSVMSLHLEYVVVLGLNTSTYVEDAHTNTGLGTWHLWQFGLFIVLALMGFLEIVYSVMDTLSWRKEKNNAEMEG